MLYEVITPVHHGGLFCLAAACGHRQGVKSIQAFVRLLRSAPRYWAGALLLLMFLTSLTEGIGLLLLVPMLAVLGGGEATGNPLVRNNFV